MRFLLFFVLLLSPSVALAQESLDDHLAVQVLELVIKILGPALMLLAILLVRRLGKKWGVEITVEHEKLIEAAVTHGAGWAEEAARRALREKGAPWRGDEKLSAATEAALRFLREHRVPELARDQLQKRIEAWLGTQRIQTGTVDSVTVGSGSGESEGGIFSGDAP